MPYRKSKSYGTTKPIGAPLVDWGHPLSKGLVAYWPCQEGAGTIIQDATGSSRNWGQFQGTFTWSKGRLGKVPSFNGTNTVIVSQAFPTLGVIGDKMSISAWFNLTASTPFTSFFTSYAGGATSYPLAFLVNDYVATKLSLEAFDGSSNPHMESTNAINDGLWHHAVGTRDAGTFGLWIDGVSNGTAAVANNNFSTTNQWIMGKYGTNFYTGLADNFMIYHRVLQPSEIKQLYADPFCLLVKPRRRISSPGVAGSAFQSQMMMSGVG